MSLHARMRVCSIDCLFHGTTGHFLLVLIGSQRPRESHDFDFILFGVIHNLEWIFGVSGCRVMAIDGMRPGRGGARQPLGHGGHTMGDGVGMMLPPKGAHETRKDTTHTGIDGGVAIIIIFISEIRNTKEGVRHMPLRRKTAHTGCHDAAATLGGENKSPKLTRAIATHGTGNIRQDTLQCRTGHEIRSLIALLDAFGVFGSTTTALAGAARRVEAFDLAKASLA
jgi:hypothetical protein